MDSIAYRFPISTGTDLKINTIDTAIQWARSLRWDGVPRVASFFTRFMSVPDTPYIRAVARYMWSALAGRCVEPGVKADMVPVFVSKQGKGKTSWFKRLATAELGAVKEGLQLDPHNKDCVFTFASHWIAELGELDSTFSKAEVGRVKAFMSKIA